MYMKSIYIELYTWPYFSAGAWGFASFFQGKHLPQLEEIKRQATHVPCQDSGVNCHEGF